MIKKILEPPQTIDSKFVKACFNSLAKDNPIYVNHPDRGSIPCMEYLLGVDSGENHISIYQFGRDDIDFSNPYCMDSDGNLTDCISRICEFHSNNVGNMVLAHSPRSQIGAVKMVENHPDLLKNEISDFGKFFGKYNNLIKDAVCEVASDRWESVHHASCLSKLIESDPFIGRAYPLSEEDLKHSECSTQAVVNKNRLRVSCFEKIIIEGLIQNDNAYTGWNKLQYSNARSILTAIISGGKNYTFNNKLLTEAPPMDPFGYPTYIDMLTDVSLRIDDKESVYVYNRSGLFYEYLLMAAGHKYDVRGNIFDVKSKFCRDRETREMIPCLDKILVESVYGYSKLSGSGDSASSFIRNVDDLISHPYFQSDPCGVFGIISKYIDPQTEFGGAIGIDGRDVTLGDLLKKIAPKIKKTLDTDGIMCQSRFSETMVPIKEYAIELGAPVIATTNSNRDVHNGKIFTERCTSINTNETITCWEKMIEIIGRDPGIYKDSGAYGANFALVNYAQRVPFRKVPSVVTDILDGFVDEGFAEIQSPNGGVRESDYKRWWRTTLMDLADNYHRQDLVETKCSNGKSSLQNILIAMEVVAPENAYEEYKTSNYTQEYISSVLRVSLADGISDTDKKYVVDNILSKLKPERSMEIKAAWLNESKDGNKNALGEPQAGSLDADLCNSLKSDPDLLIAMTASEISEDSGSNFTRVYKKCFNTTYPKPFEHTARSRKLYDYLCLGNENLASYYLAKDITGIVHGDPESMNSAYNLRTDVHDIVGVYDINLNETLDEEIVEKYLRNVHEIWDDYSDNSLRNMFDGTKMAVNVGTRDVPHKAFVQMGITPPPDVEYHTIYNSVDRLKTEGDFTVILNYIDAETGDKIEDLRKLIQFSDIITDLPKNIRSKIIKDNPKVFNKMQGVANTMRNKKPTANNLKLVISNKAADAARLTTCQPWSGKSCLNLYDGCYKSAVKAYAAFGSYIAYLVNDSPYEPEWLARLLIHNCRDEDRSSGGGGSLSIQDNKTHYTTKPRYWGIVHDAVKTIFADKGINEGKQRGCTKWKWTVANAAIARDYEYMCEEHIQSWLDGDDDGCIERCMDKVDDPDDEDDARDTCYAECEKRFRRGFNCLSYLEDYFNDNDSDEDNPFWIDYVDTHTVQYYEKDSSEYNKILKTRTSEVGDSEKFVKKISNTF